MNTDTNSDLKSDMLVMDTNSDLKFNVLVMVQCYM